MNGKDMVCAIGWDDLGSASSMSLISYLAIRDVSPMVHSSTHMGYATLSTAGALAAKTVWR